MRRLRRTLLSIAFCSISASYAAEDEKGDLRFPIPADDVQNWAGFEQTKPVDPYAGQPKLTGEQVETHRHHFVTVLTRHIGKVEGIEGLEVPSKSWPTYQTFDRWERKLGWRFKAANGDADVRTSSAGKLQARIKPAGGIAADYASLLVWTRQLVEDLWQGKLPADPDFTGGIRDVRSGGFAWHVERNSDYSSRELQQRIQVDYKKRNGPVGFAPGGKFGLQSYLVDEIWISCGNGPDRFAELLKESFGENYRDRFLTSSRCRYPDSTPSASGSATATRRRPG